MLVSGRESPIHLLYAFDETSRLTEHSCALVPTHEGHAAITVTFADVTAAEMAKEQVSPRHTEGRGSPRHTAESTRQSPHGRVHARALRHPL